MESPADSAKRAAARRAAEFVVPDMRLGLGTGSTAAMFVAEIGRRVAEGLVVRCVPTSEATRRLAMQWHIPLATLDEMPELDLTVDGTDEFDPHLRLIKGAGGALLRAPLYILWKLPIYLSFLKRRETVWRRPPRAGE